MARRKSIVMEGQQHLFTADTYHGDDEPWRGLAITDALELEAFQWHLYGADPIYVDFETDGTDTRRCEIVGIAVGADGMHRYLPVKTLPMDRKLDWDTQIAPILATLVAMGKRIVVHNGKFDLALWRRLGLPEPEEFDDTMVMAWMSDPHRRKGLKTLAAGMLDMEAGSYKKTVKDKPDLSQVPLEDAARYASEDTHMTAELLPVLKQELEEKRLWSRYLVAKAQVSLVHWVEGGGLPMDRDLLLSMKSEAEQYMAERVTQATSELRKLASERKAVIDAGKLRDGDGKWRRWPREIDPAKLVAVAGDDEDDLPEGLSPADLWEMGPRPFQKRKQRTPDPHELNIRSSEQMTAFLFETLALPTEKWEDVKKGINKSMLIRLRRDGFVLADTLLKFSKVNKLLVGFYEPILGRLEPRDGWHWLHGEFNPFGTQTGRWSCSNPNLQNLPNADAKLNWTAVRAGFSAPPGWTFVVADLSQIELRLIAHYSKDAMLRKVYRDGGDIHALTGAKLAGVDYVEFSSWCPPDGLTTDQYTENQQAYASWRKRAKPVNFGVSYMMGDAKFRNYAADNYDVWITTEEAKQYIDGFFDLYGGIRSYHHAVLTQIIERGYVPTIFGRKAFFDKNLALICRAGNKRDPDYWRGSAMWRQAVNYPIQGCTSSDTRILTKRNGYAKIGTLDGQAVTVWDGYEWADARVAASGLKQKVIVRFRGGLSIECSPDHRFLCINTRGTRTWKRPEEFAKQEYVRLTEGTEWHAPVRIPTAPPSKPGNANNACLTSIENLVELGEWLGRVASDGCVTGEDTYLLVAEHEEAILPRLRGITEQMTKSYHFDSLLKPGCKQRVHRIGIGSKRLNAQLRAIGLKEHIPEFVWADSDLLAAYLRGLFDGDGTVNADGPYLIFGKLHEKLAWAEEVQQALTLLGIRSRVIKSADRVTVAVVKKDSWLFAERVGFLNPVKQEKLAAITPGASPKSCESVIYGAAIRVQSVEVTDEWVPMYDVVDSATERFVANGLVTHNSAGDLMVAAMFAIQEKYAGSGIAQLKSQVHDEILLLVKDEYAQEVAAYVEKVMGSTAVLDQIPLKSSVKSARNWLAAH